MSNFWGHLKTITKHKFIVGKLCFKLGLIRQGLAHDLSKYSWVEFSAGVKYFQGDRSPIDAERKDLGYSKAWLHHKGHNPHHWQYWIDQGDGQLIVHEVPKKYVKEMVADRVAACMVYQKDKYHPSSALEFLQHGKETKFIPPQTKALLEHYLTIVAEHEDLNEALKIIKED